MGIFIGSVGLMGLGWCAPARNRFLGCPMMYGAQCDIRVFIMDGWIAREPKNHSSVSPNKHTDSIR